MRDELELLWTGAEPPPVLGGRFVVAVVFFFLLTAFLKMSEAGSISTDRVIAPLSAAAPTTPIHTLSDDSSFSSQESRTENVCSSKISRIQPPPPPP